MKDTQPTNAIETLRPHHALCVLFFEGKGYSQAFIENMAAFVADPSQLLRVAGGCDALCRACPNNVNDQCVDEAKVSLFDQRTVNLCSEAFQVDQPQSLSELCQIVFESILQQDLLAEVCGECEWAALCHEKWQQGQVNRSMLSSEPTSSQPF